MHRAAALLLLAVASPPSPALARRRLRCHDGVLGRIVAHAQCDVDGTANGICSFAVPCPACVYDSGCRIACARDPRYPGPALQLGERRALVGPGRKRRLVLVCRRN